MTERKTISRTTRLAKRLLPLCLLSLLLAVACRTDDQIIYSEEQDTGVRSRPSEIVGMYLLNEGNMGSNKSTLDYLDLSGRDSTIRYWRNIYSERNPSAVKELGDVGNDCKIYGSRLWLVINCSNKVEVATADSCRKIGKIDIPNCRYLAFHEGYAYVSSYVGPVAVSGDAPLGRVYKVDTLTLQKVDSVVVGYQPDELCVVGSKLYVANSGGYRVPDYDRTVSVIDLNTFREERKIDVAINLHRCRADRYGQLWVTSRGDYFDYSPNLYYLSADDNGQMQLRDSLGIVVNDLCIVGDSLYFYGAEFNYLSMDNQVIYGIINVRTHQLVNRHLISDTDADRIEMPYGIMVNPIDRDFYLMDAKNYVSSGQLLHFLSDGTFDYSVWTGDIPAHAAFLFRQSEK